MTTAFGIAAVLAGPVGIVLGWYLSRRDEDARWVRSQRAEADRWTRDALHRAAAELSDETDRFLHDANDLSAHLHAHGENPQMLATVMASLGALLAAQSRFALVAPDEMIDPAFDLGDAAVLVMGELRNGKVVGVGQPSEAEWRRIGRLKGSIARHTRKVLRGEL
jgi:hypothetical protein